MIDSAELASFVNGGPGPGAEADARPWIEALAAHRVEALAGHYQRQAAGGLERLPGPLRDHLIDARPRAHARELLQHGELARVGGALQRSRVAAIAIKGTALAYSVYPQAALRPRVDTDLLVEEADVPALRAALATLGYRRAIEPDGTLSSYQLHLARLASPKRVREGSPSASPGFVHRCDVHWRIANPQVFSRALTFAEIRETSVLIPEFAASGLRRPSASASLFIACVHRAAHHFAADTLIWLYDIHALAGSLDDTEWRALVALARKRGMAAILADGVLRAAGLFGTAISRAIRLELEDDRAAAPSPAAGFLKEGRRLVDVLGDDLRALPTWRARTSLLREHMFPPAAYMRQRYGVHAAAALPALYAYRLVLGVPRWFRRAPR